MGFKHADFEICGCLLLIAVFTLTPPGIAFWGAIAAFVAGNWPVITGVLVAIGTVTHIAGKRRRARRIAELTDVVASLRKRFDDDIIKDCLVIDSAVWTNMWYGGFFSALEDALARSDSSLTLYEPQFNEIRKLTDAMEDGECPWYAELRIERLRERDRLTIEPISIPTDETAQDEPLILRILLAAGRGKASICFVTDNRDLGTQAKERCRNSGEAEPVVVRTHDLLPLAQGFAGGVSEKLVKLE